MARTDIVSEMDAKVFEIVAAAGAPVEAGADLLILESMKMEIPVTAPAAGRLVEVRVAAGQMVVEGQVLAVFESAGDQSP
jgi:acetyl-CoA carboxylase biotin carboxyl carrier protein